MNNISIARETLRIIKEGKYEINGKEIKLPEFDYANVMVFSPKYGELIIQKNDYGKAGTKNITIVPEDSFQAARRFENPFVMNFANAHKPGGGFEVGANAQEESLCRCSTLIASIKSKRASEMYRFNNIHVSSVESDYMLLSRVCVFRDERYNLIEKPFEASVFTIAAPNRTGLAAFASMKLIEETMVRRIRIMLEIARERCYKNLVLGAWGCGAFYNNPQNVARYFKQVLIEEGYGNLFDNICFAIYGSEDSKNITAFRKCFEE